MTTRNRRGINPPPGPRQNHVVVSVPHSGTRTLVKHLNLSAREQRLNGNSWWHFGNCYALLRRGVHAHIPIRHPMDVARSWAQRPKTGQVLDALLRAYGHMFEHLEADGDECTLYRMEGLPRLLGMDGPEGAPDDSPRIREFQTAVCDQVVEPHMEFFRRYYDQEGLGIGG